MIRRTIFIALTLLLALGLFSGPAVAEEAKRVALAPITLNAPKDLDYLVQGVRDMLVSRLASPQIRLIDQSELELALSQVGQPLTAAGAAQVAQKVKADYIIFGSITKLGNRFSLNWQVLNAKDPKKPTGLARTTSEDGLIDTVDELALMARQVVSGLPPTTLVARQAPAQPASQAKPAAQPAKPKKPINVFTSSGQGQADDTDALATTFKARQNALNIFRIKPVMPAPLAMGTGDVNGDGNEDLLVMNLDSLAIYTFGREGLQQFVRIPDPMKGRLLMVSAGDVDGDGKAEIALTALYGQLPTGAIFKLEGTKLRELDRHKLENLRIIKTPNGPTVAGQKALMDRIFFGEFIRYALIGGKLKRSGVIAGNKKVDFSTLVLADLDQDGASESIGLSYEEKITVVTSTGQVIYRSENVFGGTNNYLAPQNQGAEEAQEGHFINNGLDVTDVDGDGQMEIIAAANEDSMHRYTMQLRHYHDGAVYALGWSGSMLTPKFSTPPVPQYLAGAGVIKLKDGSKQLVMAGSDPVSFGGLLNIFEKTKGYTFSAPVNVD